MLRIKRAKFLESRLIGVFLFLAIQIIFSSCASHFFKDNDPSQLDHEVLNFIQNSPSEELYPDADVIHLLDECIVEVEADGRATKTVHTVFKIVSEYGKELANRRLGYDSRTETVSLLYARTITADGKSIPLRKNAIKVVTPYSKFPTYSDYKRLVFSLSGVEVGCVIDYKYISETKPTIPGEFTDSFFFQAYDPIVLSRYKIIVPEAMNIKYIFLNSLAETRQSARSFANGNKKVYLWEQKNVPQLFIEDNTPPYAELAPRILLTTLDNWNPFFCWWRNQLQGKTDAHTAIKKKVIELIEGLSTVDEKVEAVFDYVKRHIRYVSIDMGKSGYVPASASEVFDNKYGDCKDQSTLLVSMLREAGVSAHHVLIPTYTKSNLIPEFPYPFQFNHCIVAAETENGYHYLDPVYDNAPFDYLPASDQNRRVLVFREPQPTFARTPLAKPQENAVVYERKIRIMPDQSIEVDSFTCFSGEEEAEVRDELASSGPTEINEDYEKAIHNIFPAAKLIECAYTDPLDFKQRPEISLKYYAPDYCKKAGDILIFQIPDLDIGVWCAEIGKEDRRYPVYHSSRYYQKEQVVFNIPEDYDVYHLPPEIAMKNPYFEYRSSYKKNGQEIFYEAELFETAVKIPPEEYDDYRTHCQIMNKSHTRYVLFKKQEK